MEYMQMNVEKIIYPKWAPKILIINTKCVTPNWAEKFTLSNSLTHLEEPWMTEENYKNIWIRLLTDLDMQKVFEELKRLKIGGPYLWEDQDEGQEIGYQVVEEIINNSILLRSANDLFTKKQKGAWVDDVTVLCKSLNYKLKNSHADRIDKLHKIAFRQMLAKGDWSVNKNLSIEQLDAVKEVVSKFFPVASYSEILEELMQHILSHDLRDEGERKNDSNFKRAFFIRRVASSFQTFLGEYKVSLITIMARCIFDQPELLESKVSSLIKKNT
jgi:hypothetical protein